MMNTSATNAPVRRAFRLVFALQGHSLEGLRLKQLADTIGSSTPKTLRDLDVLAEEGIVERIPGREQHWRLSPRLIQLALAHQDEEQRNRTQREDFERRYTRQI